MNIAQYLPYAIQIAITLLGFAFVLGKYKSAFDNHEKMMHHHEKILDRHEKAIEGILNRLDAMNNEFHFVKGFISARGQ
jgi:hypothetical protein